MKRPENLASKEIKDMSGWISYDINLMAVTGMQAHIPNPFNQCYILNGKGSEAMDQ